MSGHFVSLSVPIVVLIVNDKTAFLGMLKSSDFTQKLRGFAGEHGAVDDFNEASFLHLNCLLISL